MVRDADGCFIIMDIEMMNKRITLANVRGPNAGDNPGFFERILKKKNKGGWK